MRRRYLLWIVPWIVLGLSTCTTFRRPPAGPLPVASPIDPSKACASWRWIGIQRDPGAACPMIQGWQERRLFGEKDPGELVGQEFSEYPEPEVLQELNRFCVYETEKPGAVPPMSPGIVRFDRDCAALASSARPSLEDRVWGPLSTHFLSQVDRPETLPGLDESPDVRLTLVDTQPEIPDFRVRSGRSRHGYTLAHIARNLICDPRSEALCAARITTGLALRVIHFDALSRERTRLDEDGPDEDGRTGGYVGTLADLAQAIEDAVDAWRKDENRERHLVLNLSVAWDGNQFGGLHERNVHDMPAGVQAVYRALQYAEGYGVLVLAAAGNQHYGPYPDPYPNGPLLPAAWEGRQEEGSCSRPRDRPLLYAVGGVRSDGGPLANARHNGLPRRVAYADHAAVSPLDPGEPTAMYTGSSVATAVASSIAAVVWNVHPGRNAHQLMELLDRSGDELPLAADFWFGGGAPPQVRRWSVCSALRDACGDSASCRARFRCAWDRNPPLLSSHLPEHPPARILQDRPVRPPCRSQRALCLNDFSGSLPCPSNRFFDRTSQPWVFPQPEDTPCPNCVITPPPSANSGLVNPVADSSPIPSGKLYTLHGMIRKDWEKGCLTGATLDIGGPQGISIVFNRKVCAGSEFMETFAIPDSLALTLDGTTPAMLSFVVPEIKSSAQSPVLIAR